MWPIERREELAELESLVADCAKLNHTTCAIDMMASITERADALIRSDIVNGRESFVAFLRSLAVAAGLDDVVRALSDNQQPLGAEFSAVWDDNVDELYEP